MYAVYDFVTEFHQNYDDIMSMDIMVFSDMISYLNDKNKGRKRLSNQQKDMIKASKEDKWWMKDG